MPNITPADALIKAADNLVDVITGKLLEQLMEIYKIQAEKAACKARTQRVLRENAQAQRVADEQQTVPQQHPTLFPVLEVEDSYSPGSATREELPSYPKTMTKAQRATHVSNASLEH